MDHYLTTGTLLALSSKIVTLRVQSHDLTVKSPRQYRNAVRSEIHAAYLSTFRYLKKDTSP